MSEGTRPKYDNLPGIDTAPDIYETPELAEDVSTIQPPPLFPNPMGKATMTTPGTQQSVTNGSSQTKPAAASSPHE